MAIARPLLQRILALAQEAPEREVCGVLLGMPGRIEAIVPAANLADDPATAFEVDPATLFAALRQGRAGGPAVLGHYHSHPSGSPAPSDRDRAAAVERGRLWLIVAGGEARLWRTAEPGELAPLPLTVV